MLHGLGRNKLGVGNHGAVGGGYEGNQEGVGPAVLYDGVAGAVHALRLNEGIGKPEGGGQVTTRVECYDPKKIFALLGKLGSMYNRGKAKSTITTMELSELKLADGGRFRFEMTGISAKDVKNTDELLADITNCACIDDRTEGYMCIENPEKECALADELRGAK